LDYESFWKYAGWSVEMKAIIHMLLCLVYVHTNVVQLHVVLLLPNEMELCERKTDIRTLKKTQRKQFLQSTRYYKNVVGMLHGKGRYLWAYYAYMKLVLPRQREAYILETFASNNRLTLYHLIDLFSQVKNITRIETFRLTFTANIKPLARFLILQLYYNSFYTSFKIC
jgi:hypothetical protein